MSQLTHSHWRAALSLALFLLALLLATLACAQGTPPAPATSQPPPLSASQPTATSFPLRGTPAAIAAPGQPTPFAPYTLPEEEAEPPQIVPVYPLDLELITNPGALSGLSKAQQEALLANGFVVLPGAYASFSDLYREIAEQAYPLYVTVDASIHALDLLADVATLRAEQMLTADLEALSQALVAATLAQWEAASDEVTAQAAWRNLAFFAVGYRLQRPEAEVPAAVADVVQDELTLIAEGGTFLSPLFGVTQDYGRFQPAGPYVNDPALSGYARALAWYAHAFSLGGEDAVATRGVARQLLLLVQALHTSQNYSRWQRIFRPIAYFQGTASVWNAESVTVAAEARYGELPSVADVADPVALDDFVATLQAYPHPLTLSPPSTPAFRLLPAPELPDRLWLDTFVFNRIGSYTGNQNQTPLTLVQTNVGPVRGLPRALDLAAAEGSSLALDRLQAAGDTAFTGYQTQMEAARSRLEALDLEAWTQTWTGGWHYGLHPLVALPSPAPIDSPAWAAKALNSWYGGWVRLHTGTVLRPRPVAPEVPIADHAGYVEPYPAVYARLAALARQLHAGLDQYRLLDDEAGDKLLRLERLLLAFQAIAGSEMNGDALTEDQLLVLRQAGTRLENLLTFAPPPDANVPLTERRVARIVDVYPTPGGDELLQAGIGDIWPIYVLVPAEDGVQVAAGGVFSTYELRVMSAEKWIQETWAEAREGLEPAAWTGAFLVP